MVSISFYYKDYMKQALITYYKYTLKNRLFIAFCFCFVILDMVIYINLQSTMLLFIGLGVLLMMILDFLKIYFIYPRRFNRDEKSLVPVTLTINENEIIFDSKDANSKVQWSYIKKVWETRDFYYLFFDEKQYWIVPKDKFLTQTDHNQFRHITQNHHKIIQGINK